MHDYFSKPELRVQGAVGGLPGINARNEGVMAETERA